MHAVNMVIQGLQFLLRQAGRIIEHPDLPSTDDNIKRTKNTAGKGGGGDKKNDRAEPKRSAPKREGRKVRAISERCSSR